MVCSLCLRRSAVLAAAAPALARRSPLHEQWLLGVLGLPNEGLLRAVRAKDPPWILRRLQLPALTDSVPTALCCHDAGYPRALLQLPNAPAVLYATCSAERLRELLSRPVRGSRSLAAGGSRRTPRRSRSRSRGISRARV